MQHSYRVLVINPKSKTTLISIFQSEVCIFKQVVDHGQLTNETDLDIFEDIQLRKKHILEAVRKTNLNVSKINAVTSNGGIIRPVEGGTYRVNELMVTDLINDFNGKHATNLGGIIAYEIAQGLNIPAYIVDPPVVDELSDIAKFTGFPALKRKSIFHALNQKYVARKVAKELTKSYEEVNLIVAHLGYGITIGAHRKGKVIDVNNGLHGDGPFSIERAGTIPLEGIISLCFSGKYTEETIMEEITYHGGLNAYLQTKDMAEMETEIANGNHYTETVFKAMAYQIVKEVGSMATVLDGDVDGIVLTGSLAESKLLTQFIISKVAWIADVFIFAGEFDVQALNEGTLRILQGKEQLKKYSKAKGDEQNVKGI